MNPNNKTNEVCAIKKKLNLSVFTGTGEDLSEKEYAKSRNIFIWEGALATGITTMSSGVIISGILKYLGANDSINGIISGFPVAAGILLIFMPLVFRNLHRVKLTVTIFAALHRLLFSFMLAIPLIFRDNSARLYIFVGVYALAYMLGTIINPSAANWIVSLVPPHVRGRYFGLREGIMIATMTVMSLSIGIVIDKMKAIGNEPLGYFICTIIIFVFTVFNFYCLVKIKEPPQKHNKRSITLKNIIRKPLMNHKFRKVIILNALWSFGLQIGGPYFSIYFYSVLGLNYTYIMLMNVLMFSMRVFAAQIWGRLADKKSWPYVTKMSLIILGIVHASFIFMNENTYMWTYPLLQAMSGIGWGGVAISMFNIQFDYAPDENRASYVSFNTALASITGFSAILIASFVVSKIGGTISYIGSMPIHGMQYLLSISGILILLTALYVHKVIRVKDKT